MKKKQKEMVVKHLKGDIEGFKHEAMEDKSLIKKLKGSKMKKKVSKKMHNAGKKAGKALKKEVKAGKKEGKVSKVMKEWKNSELHSGSKKGPLVKSKAQALAIALSEARKAGEKVAPKKPRKKRK